MIRRLLFWASLAFLAFLVGCGTNDNGELTGVPDRGARVEPEPYNMVRIPRGSFTMGRNDEDVTWAHRAPTKTVTLESFWMDITEITNNQYRQFVFYVRDSLMRKFIGEAGEDEFFITEDELGNELNPPVLNWDAEIDLSVEEQFNAVQRLYYDQEHDQFEGRKEIDTRKLNYTFSWIDLKQAAQSTNRWIYNGDTGAWPEKAKVFYYPEGTSKRVTMRKNFIIRDQVNVYPDTLAWISDWSYSFNEPNAKNYFWHPNFDNYPVVGVSWRQAFAFCVWRTNRLNRAYLRSGGYTVHDFRLPTEAEWEYAARGGLTSSMYPWGSHYTRAMNGCVLANFKPMRGRYAEDGGVTTLPVSRFHPNEYGLYDMAGNVAEWTSTAYDESSYNFTHDLNPDYQYNARPSDSPAMKRKVIRGGSWKDTHFFLQVATRAFEYQDSTKSFIGFRCVRSCMMGDELE